jgi:hypothetical protein
MSMCFLVSFDVVDAGTDGMLLGVLYVVRKNGWHWFPNLPVTRILESLAKHTHSSLDTNVKVARSPDFALLGRPLDDIVSYLGRTPFLANNSEGKKKKKKTTLCRALKKK